MFPLGIWPPPKPAGKSTAPSEPGGSRTCRTNCQFLAAVSKSIIAAVKTAVENKDMFMTEISVANRALYDTLLAAAMERSKAIKNVALYARVSTKDGRQDTENQLIALREYCGKQGWAVVEEYVDHETGGTSKRLHFQRMFADARPRKFDLVLFWALDRFSREGVSATLNHLERLTVAGVNWRSYTEEYLDSCGVFRDAVLAILAVIAKQERVRRSERARAAIARLRRNGESDRLGRPRTEPSKRVKVRKLREQGWSLRDIADEVGISAATVQRIVAAA